MKSPVIGFIFEVGEENNNLFEGINKENFTKHFNYDFGSIKTEKGKIFDFLNHSVFLGDLTENRKKREIYVQQYEINAEFMLGEMGQEKFDELFFKTSIEDMKEDSIEDLYLDIYVEETEEPLKLILKTAYISDQIEGKETLLNFKNNIMNNNEFNY